MPSLSSVRTLSTCCFLVSGFLTEIAQQIHSLRARGVRSSHAASASASEARVFRKSSGKSWTTPPGMSLLVLVIRLYYYKIALSRKDRRSSWHPFPGSDEAQGKNARQKDLNSLLAIAASWRRAYHTWRRSACWGRAACRNSSSWEDRRFVAEPATVAAANTPAGPSV